MSSTEVLQDARAIVANKWFQGGYGGPSMGYCIVGAVCTAIEQQNSIDPGRLCWSHDSELSAAYRGAVERLNNHLPDFGWKDDLPSFNDHKTTKKHHVLGLIDKALADE